jgi:hypothetical protein
MLLKISYVNGFDILNIVNPYSVNITLNSSITSENLSNSVISLFASIPQHCCLPYVRKIV